MLIPRTSWCQAPVDGKGPALLGASLPREVLGLVTMDDLEQIILC